MILLFVAPFLAFAHDSAASPTPVPATFVEVVAALRDGQTAASQAVEEARLSDVHAVSRALADLATAAPAKASGADPATVALAALAVKTAAEELHRAAEAGDAASARAAIDRMTEPLVTLSAL